MANATAGTKGFLFCDLRGYSAFVEAKGDHAAAELLEVYRGLVRSVIATHDGAEIRTEGDSVYVVFPTASAAVEAGLGIAAAAEEQGTRERPVRVGVGIHAGETIATGEGPVGGAVNIAARVCAKAQAGEVLVTETVRALTRGLLPYTFAGIGTQSLKGIEGGIALYRVEAVPASAAAHLRRRLAAHRRLVASAIGLAALVLVGVTAAWAVNRPPDCLVLPGDTKDVVARIDPDRMCVVQVIPVGRDPGAIVATADAVWVANEADWTVTRIDLATRSVGRTLGMPGSPISLAAHLDGQVDVLAYDDRTSFTVEDSLAHQVALIPEADDEFEMAGPLPMEEPIDLNDATYNRRSSYRALAAAKEWAWVVSKRRTVTRLSSAPLGPWGNPGVGTVTIELSEGSGTSNPTLIAAIGGTVWVGDRGAPAVYRIEGVVDKPKKVTLEGKGGIRAMAVTPTELWLLRENGSLTRVDALARDQLTQPLDAPATAIAVGPDDALWLLDGPRRNVRTADPGTGATTETVEVGGKPVNAVVAGGSLWVTIVGE